MSCYYGDADFSTSILFLISSLRFLSKAFSTETEQREPKPRETVAMEVAQEVTKEVTMETTKEVTKEVTIEITMTHSTPLQCKTLILYIQLSTCLNFPTEKLCEKISLPLKSRRLYFILLNP